MKNDVDFFFDSVLDLTFQFIHEFSHDMDIPKTNGWPYFDHRYIRSTFSDSHGKSEYWTIDLMSPLKNTTFIDLITGFVDESLNWLVPLLETVLRFPIFKNSKSFVDLLKKIDPIKGKDMDNKFIFCIWAIKYMNPNLYDLYLGTLLTLIIKREFRQQKKKQRKIYHDEDLQKKMEKEKQKQEDNIPKNEEDVLSLIMRKVVDFSWNLRFDVINEISSLIGYQFKEESSSLFFIPYEVFFEESPEHHKNLEVYFNVEILPQVFAFNYYGSSFDSIVTSFVYEFNKTKYKYKVFSIWLKKNEFAEKHLPNIKCMILTLHGWVERFGNTIIYLYSGILSKNHIDSGNYHITALFYSLTFPPFSKIPLEDPNMKKNNLSSFMENQFMEKFNLYKTIHLNKLSSTKDHSNRLKIVIDMLKKISSMKNKHGEREREISLSSFKFNTYMRERQSSNSYPEFYGTFTFDVKHLTTPHWIFNSKIVPKDIKKGMFKKHNNYLFKSNDLRGYHTYMYYNNKKECPCNKFPIVIGSNNNYESYKKHWDEVHIKHSFIKDLKTKESFYQIFKFVEKKIIKMESEVELEEGEEEEELSDIEELEIGEVVRTEEEEMSYWAERF